MGYNLLYKSETYYGCEQGCGKKKNSPIVVGFLSAQESPYLPSLMVEERAKDNPKHFVHKLAPLDVRYSEFLKISFHIIKMMPVLSSHMVTCHWWAFLATWGENRCFILCHSGERMHPFIGMLSIRYLKGAGEPADRHRHRTRRHLKHHAQVLRTLSVSSVKHLQSSSIFRKFHKNGRDHILLLFSRLVIPPLCLIIVLSLYCPSYPRCWRNSHLGAWPAFNQSVALEMAALHMNLYCCHTRLEFGAGGRKWCGNHHLRSK